MRAVHYTAVEHYNCRCKWAAASFTLRRLVGLQLTGHCAVMHSDAEIASGICCFSGERYITFDEAVAILRDELQYPEDRALHFVKRFDHNKDGRLSVAEFTQFRNKIDET